MKKSIRKLVSGRFGNSATEGARIFQPGVRPRGLSNNRFQSRNRMGRSASGEVASRGQTRSRVDGSRNQKVYKRYSTKKNYDSTPKPEPKVEAKAAPQNRPQILKDLDRIKARGRGKSSRVEKDIFEPLPTYRPAQSPRSRTSTPKTGGKLAAAGTALAVGAGIGAALSGGKSKNTKSAIPAKNRAKKSASSKREDYLNTVSSKPVAKKASGSSKPAPSAMNRRENSLNMSKPKKKATASGYKMQERKTASAPISEKPVKTVKTKGGDYKVYKKDSAAAKSFRQAFADARKAGKKVFTWEGRKYSTAVK